MNTAHNIRNLGRKFSLGIGALGAIAAVVSCAGSGSSSSTQGLTKAALGRSLFFDTSLSSSGKQSCATCHAQSNAFTDPNQVQPTSEGAVHGLFGNRQAPTVAYMAFAPAFHFDATEGDYVGGQFWDGRAADLAEQAKKPLLNPIEMNNASQADVVNKVKNGSFAPLMKRIYGSQIFNDTTTAYNAIADAIAEFEKTPEVSPFSSKYDAYLKGRAVLSDAEARGLAVFNGKAGCNACHPSSPSADGTPPLFTDFTYDNIGLPKNTDNPFYNLPAQFNPAGAGFIDTGLEATTNRPQDAGRFKVPTLRNIAITGPYFHNGVFKTLEEVVAFYNARDLGGFAPPEIPQTMNTEELGDLKLTPQESSDLVAFMKTLTDGYKGH